METKTEIGVLTLTHQRRFCGVFHSNLCISGQVILSSKCTQCSSCLRLRSQTDFVVILNHQTYPLPLPQHHITANSCFFNALLCLPNKSTKITKTNAYSQNRIRARTKLMERPNRKKDIQHNGNGKCANLSVVCIFPFAIFPKTLIQLALYFCGEYDCMR